MLQLFVEFDSRCVAAVRPTDQDAPRGAGHDRHLRGGDPRDDPSRSRGPLHQHHPRPAAADTGRGQVLVRKHRHRVIMMMML